MAPVRRSKPITSSCVGTKCIYFYFSCQTLNCTVAFSFPEPKRRYRRITRYMNEFWRDVRYGIRMLLSKPGFTASAVLVLALGIGANSAVFSLINAFLLRPIHVEKPDQLAGLYSRDTKHPDTYRGFSYPNYLDIRDSN